MTRDDYLALRSRCVDHQIAIETALDAAGLDGYALVRDLYRLRDERTDAHASLSHEDRMAILREDAEKSARLLARASDIHRAHEAKIADLSTTASA